MLWFLLFHRLFGGKQSKQAPVTTAENMKNSTVISNPHATLNQVAPLLESPDGGPEVSEGCGGLLFGGGRTLGSGTGTLGSEPVSRTQNMMLFLGCLTMYLLLAFGMQVIIN